MDERATDSGKTSDSEDDESKNAPDGEGSSKSSEPTNRSQSSRTSSSSRQRADRMRQEEASRMLREITSDPDMMDHVLKAAVNPQVARELARQADVAWRNIEALPGGFRALCQMHHNIQQPLWQAVLGQDDVKEKVKMQVDQDEYSKHKNTASANAQPMPNPWNKSTTTPANPLPSTTLPFGSTGFSNLSMAANQQISSSQDARMAFQGLFPLNLTSMQNVGNTSGKGASQAPAATRTYTIPPIAQQNTVVTSANNAATTTVSTPTPPAAEATSATGQTDEQLMQRYATEMQQLAEMGINDQAKCLVALEAAKGDLFLALGILEALEQPDADEDAPKH